MKFRYILFVRRKQLQRSFLLANFKALYCFRKEVTTCHKEINFAIKEATAQILQKGSIYIWQSTFNMAVSLILCVSHCSCVFYCCMIESFYLPQRNTFRNKGSKVHTFLKKEVSTFVSQICV